MYDYKQTVKSDVREWMMDNEEELKGLDRHDTFELVYDECWISDSVTGNGSGSYTFSRYEARNNFFNDAESDDYIEQMLEDGFMSADDLGKYVGDSNWEAIDVCIRCWLLCDCINEILNEMFDD